MRHCLGSVVFCCLLACNGTNTSGSDPDLPGRTTNPEEFPYPTENWGGAEGKIFPNLTFSGVLSAELADSPTVVSMADYYDPEGLRYDLLHVVFSAINCEDCDYQAARMANLATWQAEKRIATMEIITFGINGSQWPNQAEIAVWARSHKTTMPVVIDAQGRRLEKYWNVVYLPVHVMVNPRTMEILDFYVATLSDVQAYESKFLPAPVPAIE
jgi:hypothetical protein